MLETLAVYIRTIPAPFWYLAGCLTPFATSGAFLWLIAAYGPRNTEGKE
jgi:hypothetical protein